MLIAQWNCLERMVLMKNICVRACCNPSARHEGVIIDLSTFAVSGSTPDIVFNGFTGEVTTGKSVKHSFKHSKSFPLGD